jgi:hypothetical protein
MGSWDDGTPYAAVGIPQGVIVDQDTGEIAGALRRGGEIISLNPVEYGLWSLLLTPMALPAATEPASSDTSSNFGRAVARLWELDLLVVIDPGKSIDGALSSLRPIPLGCGLGNYQGDPTRFEIQNATLSLPSPVSLDAISIMFWWEFDGASSLREIVTRVTSRVPNLALDHADTIAAHLTHGLMTSRLLYLDAPRVTIERVNT